MQIKSLLIAASTLFLLSGCFKSEAPKCSNPDVKELVKNLYGDSLENLSKNPMSALFIDALPKKIVKLNATRPIAYDEKINMRRCKAEALFDNNIKADISYTVQLSEEKSDQFYVELDTSFMEGLVQQSMMQGIFGAEHEQKAK
jgi:hypothetical protein